MSVLTELKKQLSLPLPGQEVQFKMAPEGRKNYPHKISEIKGFRESAVCLYIFEKNGKLFLPLIERKKYKGVHSGQLALPGGKIEKEDKDFIDSALREMQEETGILCPRENVVGTLTDIYIPPSNFMVKPVVAYSKSMPNFMLNAREVESLIEFGLQDLMDDGIVKETTLKVYDNSKIRTPYFEVMGKIVWGATAMILNEFKWVLKNNESIFSMLKSNKTNKK